MGNFRANIKSNSVVLITMVILGFLLCFYFFFYVSGRDVQIQDRNFRVLNKIAENVVLRSSDYYRRFTPYRDQAKKITGEYVQSKPKISNKAFVESITGSISFVQNAYVDTARQITGKPYNYASFLWFPLTDIFEDSASKKYTLNLGVDAKNFFSPLLKREEFTDFIIVHDTQIVYKTLKEGVDLNKFDSLFTKNSVFTTSSLKPTLIAGRKYALFTVPYRFRDQKNWALIGLIPESQLNKEKYSVPERFLFFVLFCMLFVFISLPLIKSVLMHPNERMKTFDILATYFSFLMGFALLVFIFFYVFNTLGPGKAEIDRRQKSLSDEITKNFMKDLESGCRQLVAYDSMVEHFPFNSVNLTKENFLFVNEAHAYCPKGYSDSTISKPFYPYFSNVFWLDSEGWDTIRWTTDASLPPKNNFTDREYFKNIKNDATWKLPGTGMSFYLQPVRSWSDGQFKGVISTKSKANLPSYKISVAGVSSRFPSVINPVLPLGYSFCIIDEKGEALFHSDVEKSTNENFKDESNNNEKLVSAMYSRTETFFDQYYSGKDCRMLISPIKGLPFYLVTIRNTGYSTAFNIQVFVFTTILFFVLVLFGLIHFFMIALFSRRKTMLKSKLLNMNWVWPNPDFEPIYLKTVLLNIITFCGTLVFCFYSNSFFSILCMFYNVFFSLASFFQHVKSKKIKRKE